MCSGLRDAANLAWKLAAMIKDGAPDALLDSYQPERAPHLRATIQMAIMMGRMVCTTSKWSAFRRDLMFRLARLLRKLPDGPTAYPPIAAGVILPGNSAAGSYFPQAIADDGTRLDDVLGADSWLISRSDLDDAAETFRRTARRLAGKSSGRGRAGSLRPLCFRDGLPRRDADSMEAGGEPNGYPNNGADQGMAGLRLTAFSENRE
jgi:hypothetical protein